MDFATPKGTASYLNLKNIESFHFRKSVYTAGLTLSTLGIGTYLGGIDNNTDFLVEEAVKNSVLSGGINVIDTAINYRYQKAERSIGRVLTKLFSQNVIKREQIFISTKNGYVPGDADRKMDPKSYCNMLLEENIIDRSNIVDNSHSIHPNFLEHQLNQSLKNLQLKTIDLLYLHNSAESQLSSVGMKEYLTRLKDSFIFLEQKREEKKIRYYGLATWNCFRVPPSQKKNFLNLQDVVSIAKEVGGENHGFKFVQLPINLLMNESFTQKWQIVDNTNVSFLEAADRFKIGIFGSVPLLQTKLFQGKVPNFAGLTSKSQKLLQFVRSIPNKSVIAPIVGQKAPDHVDDNLTLLFEPPVSKESFESYLQDFPKMRR